MCIHLRAARRSTYVIHDAMQFRLHFFCMQKLRKAAYNTAFSASEEHAGVVEDATV